MTKKAKTQAEKDHHERIAGMSCILCDLTGLGPNRPVHVHHLQNRGVRSNHFLVMPLCPECHQGANGIHGDKALLRIARVEEIDLLALTIEKLMK